MNLIYLDDSNYKINIHDVIVLEIEIEIMGI